MPITVAGQAWNVLGPADPDALIDLALEGDDDRLPYWAQLWPSGVVLAEAILTDDVLAGRRVLELGCGLGLTAAAALLAGADLLAVDCEPGAVAFAAYNATVLAGTSLKTKLVNWRDPDAVVRLAPPYDVVLAADVLYERRDVCPLAVLIPQLLAPGGWLWLAEPRREAGRLFLAQQHAAGWRDAACAIPFEGLGQQVTVDLHHLSPP